MPPLVLQSWCQNGSRLSLHAEMNHFSQPVICWLALKLVRPRSFRFLFVLNEMHSLICFATKKKKNSRSMKVYDCNVSPDYHRYVLNLFKWKKALTKRIKPFWNSRFPKIISVAFALCETQKQRISYKFWKWRESICISVLTRTWARFPLFEQFYSRILLFFCRKCGLSPLWQPVMCS